MKKQHILKELGEHLPFSIFFTAAGIVLAAILTYGAIIGGLHQPPEHEHEHEKHNTQTNKHDSNDSNSPKSHDIATENHDHDTHTAKPSNNKNSENEHAQSYESDEHNAHMHEENDSAFSIASAMLFHIFHPVHLLLSAMATTAMFYRYEKKAWKAIIVGFIGSVGVCGLSDVFMPYLSMGLLGIEHMHFHWCLIEHPWMVLPFAFLGILSGMLAATAVDRSTIISHSAHIFISSTASLFYLISYGVAAWYSESMLPWVFLIVILCVTIPCCLSDILLPLLIADSDGEEIKHGCGCAHHQH